MVPPGKLKSRPSAPSVRFLIACRSDGILINTPSEFIAGRVRNPIMTDSIKRRPSSRRTTPSKARSRRRFSLHTSQNGALVGYLCMRFGKGTPFEDLLCGENHQYPSLMIFFTRFDQAFNH